MMGGVFVGLFAYIKVLGEMGRSTIERGHVTAGKAADSNCDILFLRGRPSILVIVSSSSHSSVEKCGSTLRTIVKLISV